MEYNGEDIKKEREIIRNNITQSFDIEKSVAVIGEIRKWNDGYFKKVAEGKWVKLSSKNEEKIESSEVIGTIKKRVEDIVDELNKHKEEFKKTISVGRRTNTSTFEKFFKKGWQENIKNNSILSNLLSEQKDLQDEIQEIYSVLEKEEKKKEGSGRRKIRVRCR